MQPASNSILSDRLKANKTPTLIRFTERPATEPERSIWDEFKAYYGERKFAMRKRSDAAGGWWADGPRCSGASILCARAKRKARWYKSAVGLGIEMETGSDDPDFAWAIAGAVEPAGKHGKVFKAIIGSGEAIGTGYGTYLGTFFTIDAAKAAVVAALKCEVVATEDQDG